MAHRNIPIDCHILKRPSGRQIDLELDLADLAWTWRGAGLERELSPAARDLVEVGRVVHQIERGLSRRITGERVRSIRVEMPVRAPRRWTRKAREALSELLYIQGNADWTFAFSERSTSSTLDAAQNISRPEAAIKKRAIDAVVLFSAGLDSTSGLASLRQQADRHLLAAYYSGNLKKQQKIASALGYRHLVQLQGQWSAKGEAAFGGQFWYRSFLFLCIGAALADTAGAGILYQFENGPLALAVPPAPIYRMTRHAHPSVHRNAQILFEEVLGKPIEIRNPFLTATKKQEIALLRQALTDRKAFSNVVSNSETCWYLKSSAIVGSISKNAGTPCGVCIPCIVRRTALGNDEVETAINLASAKDRYAKNPVARIHLDACLDFAKRLTNSKSNVAAFVSELPLATASVIGTGPGLSPEEVFALYRRFARELLATFA
jgi:7-cyano-7-deazaguanine synthase in queuosine biosynthesis